jgi:hypothetical protein
MSFRVGCRGAVPGLGQVPVDATLATRDTDDFEETGIEVVNPWRLG